MPRIVPATGDLEIHRYKRYPLKAWFEYHCWESEKSSDAPLWRRTHQRVLVLSKDVDSDSEMYKVQFADGHIGHVFADELTRSKKSFHRPDYSGDSHE